MTHQLTRPRIVGIYDSNGAVFHEGAAGSGTDTSVSLTFQPTSTGSYFLAVGSNPGDTEGLYSFYVKETGTGNAGQAATNNSPTGGPGITGLPRAGEVLTATTSGIADADGLENASFSYQWVRHDPVTNTDTDIPGATGSTYTVTREDRDRAIKVRVDFTDDAGNDETMTSFAILILPPANTPATGAPAVNGTVRVGGKLTVDTSGVSDDNGMTNAAFTYQWIRSDGAAGTEIENATGASYTLVEADEGKSIKVRVSFTDDDGYRETLTSAATDEVTAGGSTEPPGAPRNLTGAANPDGTVTLRWDAPDDDSVTGYQILRRRPREGEPTLLVHVNDTGSTATEYTDKDVTPDVLHVYRVKAINAAGLSRWSNFADVTPTQPAQNSPATGAPTISGAAQVGETLTADTSGIADTDGLTNVSYSYQWVVSDGGADLDITGATDSTYTLVAVDQGLTIKVKVSFTDDAGNGETLTSATMAAVEAAPTSNSPATGAPTISGTVQVGETLRAHTSGIADEDGLTDVSYSYQWIRNDGSSDTDITGGTDSTYALVADDEGKTIKIRVSFTDDYGYAESLTSTATTAVAAKPNTSATGLPTIGGTAQVGETLTADTSGIADADGLTKVSYSYQWVANDGTADTDISGAASSTYPLVDADQGKTVKVRVSFTDDAGNEETLASSPSEPVEPAATESSDPDATRAGAIDLGDITTLARARYPTYDINGVDDVVDYFMFTITEPKRVQIGIRQLDADATLTLEHEDGTVIGHKSKPGEEHVAMYPTLLEGAYYVRVEAAEEGVNEYRMAHGVNEPNPDRVAELREKATPSNGATGAPTIGGTAQVEETLTADISGIADDDGLENAAFSYQWIASDGTSDTDIPGATDSTYTLVAADVGKTIKVRVSFTDDAGNDESLTSAATDEVGFAVQPQTANDPATGEPVITGTAQVGETLTADTSGISDANGLAGAVFAYQWLADDAEIASANEGTYVLTSNEMDKTIKVRVSFTDDSGNEETLTSAATGAVSPAVQQQASNTPATGAPTISVYSRGDYVGVGLELEVDTSDITDEDGLTGHLFRLQWIANDGSSDADIPGATFPIYTLEPHDEGKTIKVRVSFTDARGNAESLTSAATGPVGPDIWEPPMTLSGLSVSQGTLTPTFNSNTHSYTVPDVANAETRITITPTFEEGYFVKFFEASETWSGLWVSVNSGNPSGLSDDCDRGDSGGDRGSFIELTDADPDTPGFQVDLYDGDNWVHVRVFPIEECDFGDGFHLGITRAAGTVSLPRPNSPPVGRPYVTVIRPGPTGPESVDRPRVGYSLNADVSQITDRNGMANATFGYQWLVDDVEIAGATGFSYPLTTGELGKTIKVRVSITDDDGYMESLTSTATETVFAFGTYQQQWDNSPATGAPIIYGTAQMISFIDVSFVSTVGLRSCSGIAGPR